jgi:hypothetical protein
LTGKSKLVVDFDPKSQYNESSRTEIIMYDKLAQYVNEKYNRNLDANDVEDYLRYGDTGYLKSGEDVMIDDALDQFL